MTAGVYIAHHPWLDLVSAAETPTASSRLFKVGHSGNLAARLLDSCYQTCFSDGWRYRHTYELPTKEDAFRLETAVLNVVDAWRVDGRELVALELDRLHALVLELASELGLDPVIRTDPEYPPEPRAGSSRGAGKLDPGDEPRLLLSDEEVARVRARGLRLLGATGSSAAAAAASAAVPMAADDEDPFADLLRDDDLVGGFEEAAAAAKLAADAAAAMVATTTAAMVATTTATTSDRLVTPVVVPPLKPMATSSGELGEDDVWDETDFAAEAEAYPAEQGLTLREYQQEAIDGAITALDKEGKAILQMACRCGKTPVAYGVMQKFTGPGSSTRLDPVLFLVPGLGLLRQTVLKLHSYGLSAPILLVGSDPRPIAVPGREPLAMTTDPGEIMRWFEGRAASAAAGASGLECGLVISTYQSSPLLLACPFSLQIFDEAHRCCGGKTLRPFNHMLLGSSTTARRLFMTATPAYDGTISMRDRSLFGGIAYRYHLRQGIEAGYVNDFALELVAAEEAPGDTPAAVLARQILTAFERPGVDKLLVFCQNIRHCTTLAAATTALLAGSTAAARVLVAHSRMAAGGAVEALAQFSVPGQRLIMFNCRLFQEGVEIPDLNAIFFAAPRHSPRDIIQSLCRPLNARPGKPVSRVFIPVAVEAGTAVVATVSATPSPQNLKRFATIVPFVDALMSEDPRLYEHLLDPGRCEYPLELLGVGLGLTTPAARRCLLEAARQAVRYGGSASERERLLRVEHIPWDRGYAELRRIVETCDRYPKTTDAWVVGEARVCLHRFYRWAADEYAKWMRGEPSKLEPHQRADLERLRGWLPYGVEGPYPWKESMAFLRQWLLEHDGVPPMVEINKGGFVGLSASPMERLSGALTCINQQVFGKLGKDGTVKQANRVPEAQQHDLDALAAEFGLRWRKQFLPSGEVDEAFPTFIQESYRRFKEEWATRGTDSPYIQRWFVDYPLKHLRQELLSVQESGAAPDRYRSGKASAKAHLLKSKEEPGPLPKPDPRTRHPVKNMPRKVISQLISEPGIVVEEIMLEN